MIAANYANYVCFFLYLSEKLAKTGISGSLFSPLGKLADWAIYFVCVDFFIFFNLRTIFSGYTGPIFTFFH